jgi:hypothetical protein
LHGDFRHHRAHADRRHYQSHCGEDPEQEHLEPPGRERRTQDILQGPWLWVLQSTKLGGETVSRFISCCGLDCHSVTSRSGFWKGNGCSSKFRLYVSWF